MSLVLEIEYLTGTCFAAIGPDSEAPDWPPQPDRVFSALVATWGARGEKDDEALALEWLESQLAPDIDASADFPRTAPTCFVPPNDPAGNNKTVMPAWRRRQARRFPATRPQSPIVHLLWPDATPDDSTLNALVTLAADTSYIGHSSSLTRCQFRYCDKEIPFESTRPKRWVYPGRLAELQRSYEEFTRSNGKRGRPLAGYRVKPEPHATEKPPQAFADNWLLLELVSDETPDIRASAIVARAIRDTLLAGYRRIGLEERIPEIVSGHANDGSPSREPHLAIIPLAFVGFPHADGHVMGFALVPPRDSGILDDTDFRRALRKIAPLDENRGRRLITVNPKAGTTAGSGFSIGLSPTFEPPPGRRSLDPVLYTQPARTFATVTPIVLDRHLKKKGEGRQEEIVSQIKAACRNIGLPEPSIVVPDKHSAVEGAPSAWRSGNSPIWMNWRLPASIASRQLTHAVIHFDNSVQGPVLLGAGRFAGLGLCRPFPNRENRE